MDREFVIQVLIEELDFEISLLDPKKKAIEISNLTAQKRKYEKYLASLTD